MKGSQGLQGPHAPIKRKTSGVPLSQDSQEDQYQYASFPDSQGSAAAEETKGDEALTLYDFIKRGDFRKVRASTREQIEEATDYDPFYVLMDDSCDLKTACILASKGFGVGMLPFSGRAMQEKHTVRSMKYAVEATNEYIKTKKAEIAQVVGSATCEDVGSLAASFNPSLSQSQDVEAVSGIAASHAFETMFGDEALESLEQKIRKAFPQGTSMASASSSAVKPHKKQIE